MARWNRINSRGNVQDRRGMAPVMAGGLGTAGIVLALVFAFLSEGETAIDILSQTQHVPGPNQAVGDQGVYEGEDEYEVFASTVLGSANSLWRNLFELNGEQYREPTLVLFRQATQSSCGGAHSAIGPHYCPVDETIYLDETFFDELTSRLGAEGGDVAEAYVIAHEVGHHVQELLGVNQMVRSEQTPTNANDLSVKVELQADCFAGMWAHSIRDLGVLEPGEIREAMDAAEAVGDDRIQQTSTGRINPESWTHGSSEQRAEWFERGYENGRFSACNTFE